MDEICRRCHCTITDAAAVVTVTVGKEHVYCSNCWNGIEPKWHHQIKKYFPLQNLRILTSPYVHFDAPRQHFNPLPVEHADASMA
ncbi:MAG TPA: hypothetical protein VIH59_25310 [Candidatus Tectomicrobia bacterium]|jgi:hypothetical protein